MRYEVNGWATHGEVDVYEEGCTPGTDICNTGSDRFKADSIEGLIEALMEFAGTEDPGAVLRDSCDEEGRVDIQVYETATGPASDHDVDEWKAGHITLWLVIYVFHVEEVERKTVRTDMTGRVYRFSVPVLGTGDSVEEAWKDAVEQFGTGIDHTPEGELLEDT